MADHTLTSTPSTFPRLPVEVWERIIDMVAGPSYEYVPMDHRVQKDLNACRLVCRDWVSRCRLHLFAEVSINSRETLHSLMKFLRVSPFHADLVLTLRIHGGGLDQSWVSSIPFCLPRLPRLTTLHIEGFDFSHRHPRFYQAFSSLRTAPQSTRFILSVHQSDLRTVPVKITALSAALHFPDIIVAPNGSYPVHTPADASLVQSWPRKLAGRTAFDTSGTVQELLAVLTAWTFPVRRWEITMQSTLPESLDGLSHGTQRVWDQLSRIFSLTLAAHTTDARIIFKADGICIFIHPSDHDWKSSPEYAVSCHLDNADDITLAYLAHILPSLATCGLTSITIFVKDKRSAVSQMWPRVDGAILKLSQSTVSKVDMLYQPNADIPSWETYPYECEDEFTKQILPKCAVAGLTSGCNDNLCQLHDPQRWQLQTRGTPADVLETLLAWTCPVKEWKIVLQSTPLGTLNEPSQQMQRIWKEIYRVFSLSITARRPDDVRIEFHSEGLGYLILSSVSDIDPVEHGMWAMLDDADDAALAYLSEILPYLSSCGLSHIQLQLKNSWSAAVEAWRTLDEAILQLIQGTVRTVCIYAETDARLATWEIFPYQCINEFCQQMLPRCFARGSIMLCDRNFPWCGFHDPQRRPRSIDDERDMAREQDADVCGGSFKFSASC